MSSYKGIVISLLLLLTAVSCREGGAGTLGQEPGEPVYITARAALGGFTKGSVLKTVPDFALYGYQYSGSTIRTPDYCTGEKMTSLGTSFVSSKRYAKAQTGYNTLLVGIAPYGAGGWTGPSGTGTPKILYTTPESCADQKDVLVASYGPRTGFDGNCEMTFSHILAGVRFSVSAGGSFNGTLKEIALEGINTNGTYTVGSGWSGQGYASTRTVLLNRAMSLYDSGLVTTDSQMLFLLPQTTPDGAKIKVTANVDGKDNVLYAPFSRKTLSAGSMYTYSIDFSSMTSSPAYLPGVKGGAEALRLETVNSL